MSDARRFLIVRLTAIGDCMHALPVACALRAAFPQSTIGWLVEGRGGDLLEGHEAIDELIRVPRRWLKSPAEILKLRRRLRALDFDLAIDVQGLAKSAIAARLSGASQRIGFAPSAARELSWLLTTDRVPATATHVIDRNLQLLRPLGIERPAVEFRLPEAPADAGTIERFLAQTGLPSHGFAVINPGAGWPSKRWPPERFAAVARDLERVHRLPSVIVWAGDAERALAGRIVAEAPQAARLAPATSLRELAALLRRARLVVAADTGPLHLAVAVETPSIGLFGPMPHERNGPYGEPHIALQQARIEGSKRKRRNATNETMRAISVEHVEAACDEILARPWSRTVGSQVA